MTETTTATTYDFGRGPIPALQLPNGAWVALSATVHTGASVGAWASVGARARVGEGASVGEGAGVGAWARVGARASVGADEGSYMSIGPIGSRHAMLHAHVSAGNMVVLTTGCFTGSLDELLAACVKEHGPDSVYTAQYRALAPLLAGYVQQCADRRRAEAAR